MNRDEAREILDHARPAGPTHDDPRVAEALRLAEADPELRRFLDNQRALDQALTKGIRSITVPAHLQESILASRKIVRPHFWQDWRTAAAAAAAIVLLLVGSAVAIGRGATNFSAFRTELVAESWAGDPHLKLESADLGRIRRYLASSQAASDFVLPEALNDLRPHGAAVFDADGQKVALICLADGARHLHLFVFDSSNLRDLPPDGAPDFQKCGSWKTTSWRQGKNMYVLTGMNYPTFVSKFRKSGRWLISG